MVPSIIFLKNDKLGKLLLIGGLYRPSDVVVILPSYVAALFCCFGLLLNEVIEINNIQFDQIRKYFEIILSIIPRPFELG